MTTKAIKTAKPANTITVMVELKEETLLKIMELCKLRGVTFDQFVNEALTEQYEHNILNINFQAIVEKVNELPDGTVFKLNETITSVVGRSNRYPSLQKRLRSYFVGKKIATYNPTMRNFTRTHSKRGETEALLIVDDSAVINK